MLALIAILFLTGVFKVPPLLYISLPLPLPHGGPTSIKYYINPHPQVAILTPQILGMGFNN